VRIETVLNDLLGSIKMIHFNTHLKNSTLFLVERILPEVYQCTTIRDFKDNADQIRPTRKILPVGIFYNGRAFVYLTSALFRFSEDSEKKGFLTDLTDSLEVTVRKVGDWKFGLCREEFENLENGMKLYRPHILYRPRDGEMVLLGYTPQGPPVGEESRKLVSGMQESYSFT